MLLHCTLGTQCVLRLARLSVAARSTCLVLRGVVSVGSAGDIESNNANAKTLQDSVTAVEWVQRVHVPQGPQRHQLRSEQAAERRPAGGLRAQVRAPAGRNAQVRAGRYARCIGRSKRAFR